MVSLFILIGFGVVITTESKSVSLELRRCEICRRQGLSLSEVIMSFTHGDGFVRGLLKPAYGRFCLYQNKPGRFAYWLFPCELVTTGLGNVVTATE